MLGRHVLAKALGSLADALEEVGETEAADACARAAARLSRPEHVNGGTPSIEDPIRSQTACRAFRPRVSEPRFCSLCLWSFEAHEKRTSRGETPFERMHQPICLEDPCPWHGKRADRIQRRGT